MEKLHIQPTELDLLPYYEYELTISIYNDIIKERNEQENKNTSKERDKYNISGMQKNMTKNFKTPKLPSIKTPKL